MTLKFVVAAILVAQPVFSQAVAPEQQLTEELRIVSMDGTEPLSAIGSATVSPDGTELFVTQPLDRSVLVFDADTGEYLRSIEHASSAPNGLRQVGSIGWIADTLYVTDPRLKRVALFTGDGDPIETVRIDTPLQADAPLASRPLGLTATGNVISEVPFPAPALSEGVVPSSPWALLERDGSVVATLGLRDLRETTVALASTQGRVVFEQPLTQRNHLALHPDGTSIAIINQPAGSDAPGTYDVVRLGPDGARVSTRTFSYTPARVSPAMAHRLRADLLHHLDSRTTDPRIRATLAQHITIPRFHPPVSGVILGRDDTMWLRMPIEEGGTTEWLVVGPSGDPVARVHGPAGLRLLFTDEGMVWGALDAGAGPPSLVRFGQIHPGTSSSDSVTAWRR